MADKFKVCIKPNEKEWSEIREIICAEICDGPADENVHKLMVDSKHTECFFVKDENGKVAGFLANIWMNKELYYVGIFIMGKEFRGKGIGTKLWSEMMQKLERSSPIMAIDSASEMTAKYRAKDFPFASSINQVAMRGNKESLLEVVREYMKISDSSIQIEDVGAKKEALLKFDQSLSGRNRSEFINCLLALPVVKCLVAIDKTDTVVGYGVLFTSYAHNTESSVSSLYANDLGIALQILEKLLDLAQFDTISIMPMDCQKEFCEMLSEAQFEVSLKLERSYSADFVEMFDQNRVFSCTRHVNQADCSG